MNITARFLCWINVFLISAVSCGYAAGTKNTGVTEKDYEAFGRELVGYVNHGEALKMIAPFDYEGLVARITKGTEFAGNGLVGLMVSGGIKSGLEKDAADWKSARLVRAALVHGEGHVLVRLLSKDDGLDFFDFVCVPSEKGSFKIVDYQSYRMVELVSETARRGLDESYVRALAKFAEAQKLLDAGESKKALALLENLPAQVQRTPVCLLRRLLVARHIDKKTYDQVSRDWEKARPGDPSLDLVSFDGCFLQKDYQGCVRHIESLQKHLGGDGYLQAVKANVYKASGDLEKAKAAIREANKQEPTLPKGYDIWFGIELEAKSWSGLAEALRAYDANFDDADLWNRVKDRPSWAPFGESAECKAWLEERAAKSAPAEKI